MSGRRYRARLGTAVCALLLLAAASCTAVSGVVRTQAVLSRAGYKNASIGFVTENNGIVLTVGYDTDAIDVPALAREYLDVSEVIWKEAPLRFDAITVKANDAPGICTDDCVDRFDRVALAGAHGARDPDLDKSIENELLGAGLIVLAVIAIASILLISLYVRSRRRAKARQAGWYQPQGNIGYLPPGYVPNNWGGPPPAGGPHPPAPDYAPPPPGFAPPPSGSAPPGGPFGPPSQWPGQPPGWSGQPGQPSGQPGQPRPGDQPPAQWPPAAPPPPFDAEPAPPMPTHDIWERPPS